MTRDEHLAWAKKRALEAVDQGDLPGAIASLISDMRKHPELEDHSGLMLTGMLMVAGHLSSEHSVRRHIEGFQ